MHREPLLALLGRYRPTEPHQQDAHARLLAFVREHPDCLSRDLAVGHITSSAWIENHDCTCALLTHHRKLGKWLQLGGHVDGEPDVLKSAIREAQEESGIDTIEPVHSEIFDLDIHEIPAYGGTPAHFHYDVRFWLRATQDVPYVVSEESIDLAWVTPSEFSGYPTDESVVRLHRKWLNARRADARPQ